MCKRPRRLRSKSYELCKNETHMMREISKGIHMGFRECEYQFKNRRWNCTSVARSMKKILSKGMCKLAFCSKIKLKILKYSFKINPFYKLFTQRLNSSRR